MHGQISSHVTKHVSHFCGTNRQLSRMDPSVANVCPCCGAMDETTSHIVRCPSQGRTALFHNSVSELVEWLEEVDTDPFLVIIIQTFLLGRDELTTISLPHDALTPKYELVCQQVCLLGFDYFVEGRIPSVLVLVDFQR